MRFVGWLRVLLIPLVLVHFGCSIDASFSKVQRALFPSKSEVPVPPEKVSDLSLSLTSDNWPFFSDPTPVISAKGVSSEKSLIVSYDASCVFVAAYKKVGSTDNGFVRLSLPAFTSGQSRSIYVKTEDACQLVGTYQFRPIVQVTDLGSMTVVRDSEGYAHCLGECRRVQKDLLSLRHYENLVGDYGYALTARFSDGSVKSIGFLYGTSTPIPDPQPSGVTQLIANGKAFAALKSDGTVVAWGDATSGGDAVAVTPSLTSVTKIFATNSAFAALKSDGTVVAWGDATKGGTAPALSGVVDLRKNGSSFVALKSDGTAVPWGDSFNGGNAGAKAPLLTNVVDVISNDGGNAYAALKSDGTVVAWGHTSNGGDSSAVDSQLNNVQKIVANSSAFCAYRSVEPAVICWGYVWSGGTSPGISGLVDVFGSQYGSNFFAEKADGTYHIWPAPAMDFSVALDDISNVKKVIESYSLGIYILREDGRVVTVGDNRYGGDSIYVDRDLYEVEDIFKAANGYLAWKKDGSLVFLGNQYPIGVPLSARDDLKDVKRVIGTRDIGAFAALTEGGRVVTWGEVDAGGQESRTNPIFEGVSKIAANSGGFFAHFLDEMNFGWGSYGFASDVGTLSPSLTGVSDVPTTSYAFGALKTNGDFLSWGDGSYGGGASWSGVNSVVSNNYAFAGLRADGGVYAIGDSQNGGSTAGASGSLTDIVELASATLGAFAGRKTDGTVVTWGKNWYGAGSGMPAAGTLVNVVKLTGGNFGFAALKNDGTGVSWGGYSQNHTNVPGVPVDLKEIFAGLYGFYGWKNDNSLVFWGLAAETAFLSQNASDFQNITRVIKAGEGQFVGIRSDGKIVAWGERYVFSTDLINSVLDGNRVKDAFGYGKSLIFILDNGAVQVY